RSRKGVHGSPDIDPLIGRHFGEFEIVSILGEGGYGTVYRAYQPLLDRDAVIKVLRAEHRNNPQIIQRFSREARIASRIDHPFAAHVYAFGVEDDGLLWIAMEYVRGTPLDHFVDVHGPIDADRVADMLERICEVVHHAHELG